MVKFYSIISAVAFAFILTFICIDWTSANQTEGIVFVKKPIFIGDGEVEPKIYRTGIHFHAETTDGVIVDMSRQEKEIKFNDLATDDKVPVDFRVAVQFELDPEMGWKVIAKYTSLENWYKTVFVSKFSEMVRNHARQNQSEDMMYNEETLTKMSSKLKKDAIAYLAQDEWSQVIINTVIIGKANPPQALMDEISETSRQKQRKKTEEQRKLAEKERKAAETARAQADSEYQSQMNMTTNEYLRSRDIDNRQKEIANQTLAIKEGKNVQFIITSGGSVTPVKSL